MARKRNSALWVAADSGYGADPDSDGSDYLWIPATDLGLLKDGRTPIETNFFTGRNWPTARIQGPDSWSLDFTIPIIGLATAAGDGTNASSVAADWFDVLLTHIFGAQATTAGEGVAVGSTTSSLVADTDAYGIQDVVPVFEAGLPSATEVRTQWTRIEADAGTGTYGTVAPAFETAPTTAGIVYGAKRYTFDNDGGATLAFYLLQDDAYYTLLGGRCSSGTINIPAGGGMCTMSLSFRGDSKTHGSKASVPAAGSGPAVTPCRSVLSPFYFGGTEYGTPQVTINLGLAAAVIESTAGAHGRAGDELIEALPTVDVNPLFTNALQDLKRNATTGAILQQIGAGVLSGGVLNTCAVHIAQAQAIAADPEDENKRIRAGVSFELSDPVTVGGAAARPIQFLRA